MILNGENATHGFGLSPEHARGFFEAGVDCIILGNHSFDRKEIIPMLDEDARIIRPINYPKGTPGRGKTLLTGRNGHRVGVHPNAGPAVHEP